MFTSGSAQTPYRPAGLVLDTEGLDFSGPPVACPLYTNRALALSEEQCGGKPPRKQPVPPLMCQTITFGQCHLAGWTPNIPLVKQKCQSLAGHFSGVTFDGCAGCTKTNCVTYTIPNYTFTISTKLPVIGQASCKITCASVTITQCVCSQPGGGKRPAIA